MSAAARRVSARAQQSRRLRRFVRVLLVLVCIAVVVWVGLGAWFLSDRHRSEPVASDAIVMLAGADDGRVVHRSYVGSPARAAAPTRPTEAVPVPMPAHQSESFVTAGPRPPRAVRGVTFLVALAAVVLSPLLAAFGVVQWWVVPVALVALETPVRTRSVLAESLGAPLVAAGPTRWRMSAHCPADLLAGRWPGQRETTMTRLVRDVSMFVARLEREPSWA